MLKSFYTNTADNKHVTMITGYSDGFARVFVTISNKFIVNEHDAKRIFDSAKEHDIYRFIGLLKSAVL